MTVLGRVEGGGPTAALGHHRARDGSDGSPLELDLAGPHAACVVGKRGSGKSNTLAVLAEELAATVGAVPVVADPMGAFAGLDVVGAEVVDPRVRASALAPRSWPAMLGLEPHGGPGSLVWRAATVRDTLDGMRAFVGDADAPQSTRRAAGNVLTLAAEWDVFGPDGVAAPDAATVLDLGGVPAPGANAVLRAVASACFDRRVASEGPLPWLLVDEAHAFFAGVAAPALRRVLTRGRAPGVSLVVATQRPDALPDVALSQSDLLVAHRLSGRAGRDRIETARPDYVTGAVETHRPTAAGEALVYDDANERAHPVRVRERTTPHGGDPPRLGRR